MEAQRYPEDFDGYVVGAPVLFLTGLQMKSIWTYQLAGNGPGAIKSEKLRMLSKAVYQKCDALDGVEDGLIENPAKCKLDTDPARMSAVALRIDATIPDLTGVKMRGGKIVHYHGWADPGVTPRCDSGNSKRKGGALA